jgi:hypothetical protein
MKQRMFKRAGVVLGAVLIAGTLTGTAAAVITADAGGAEVRVDKRTNNVPSSTSQTQWQDLPGASVLVFVPENQSRLYDVPFFAETQCNGPNGGGACTVRIIATDLAGGPPIELNPQAGADYAFDSDMVANLDDLREGHGMERSRRLAGDDNGTTYQIEVQYAVTDPTTTFTLDDWHLAVHTNL